MTDAYRAQVARAAPTQEKTRRDKLRHLEEQHRFWLNEVARQTQALRAAGKAELDAALDDPARRVVVPGRRAMPLKAAADERDAARRDNALLHRKFHDTVAQDPEAALAGRGEINARLQSLAARVEPIEAAIRSGLWPKGRQYLAEQALVEVADRFGPHRQTSPSLAQGASPAPAGGAAAQDAGDGPVPAPPPPPLLRKRRGLFLRGGQTSARGSR